MMVALMLFVQAAVPPGGDCKNPNAQSVWTRCAWQDFGRADAELNRTWRIALARSRRRSRDNPMPGVTTYEAALVKGQRAWVVYRDAQCAIEGQDMRGGSGEPMLEGQCRARLTRERTRFLEQVNN